MAAGGKGGIVIEGSQKIISILEFIRTELPRTSTMVLEKVARQTTDQMQRNAPVDTGNLRNNISYNIMGTKAEVISDAEYSGYVNYGTSKMSAQSFFSDGVEYAKQELPRMIGDEVKKNIMSRR